MYGKGWGKNVELLMVQSWGPYAAGTNLWWAPKFCCVSSCRWIIAKTVFTQVVVEVSAVTAVLPVASHSRRHSVFPIALGGKWPPPGGEMLFQGIMTLCLLPSTHIFKKIFCTLLMKHGFKKKHFQEHITPLQMVTIFRRDFRVFLFFKLHTCFWKWIADIK